MATPSKKGKYLYEANDIVDDQLFEVVTKHVNIDNISTFGQSIGGDESLDVFAGQPDRVLNVWRKQQVDKHSVFLFLREITRHESEGFINPYVWQELRLYVHPDVLPTEREENTNIFPADSSSGYLSDQSMSSTFDIKSKTRLYPYHQKQGSLVMQDPKLTVNRLDLGTDGCQFSDLVRRLGQNPTVTMINIPGYSMSLDKSVEFMQFLSKCRLLTHIDMSENIMDTSAHHLAKSIRSWGDKPALEVLWLYNCSLSASASFELVQSLSTCRLLTELSLGGNKLGEAGHQLAQSIRSWGDEPPLQKLYLHNCSLTVAASLELVQSLSTCRLLTELRLGENKLDEAGHQLAQSIKSWGDEPQLQVLGLSNCSLSASALLELIQSLSSCRHLTMLDLGENKIGEAGHQLAQSIRSWGDEPLLEVLWLHDCSLTVAASLELLQVLSSCRYLTELSLGENSLGEAGHQLAKSIRSWRDEPPLQLLGLYNCSLSASALLELIQSLSSCRHLIMLDLGENKIGEAGHQLAQSIRSWGDEPPLQNLLLYNCALSASASLELIQSLSSCRHLTVLDLEENELDEIGHQLAQSIRSWGDKPALQALQLYNSSLSATGSLELVKSLTICRYLTVLSLGGNKLGAAGHQLSKSIQSWGNEPQLQNLSLHNCSLTASASLELVQSLSTCKNLAVLELGENKLCEAGQQLAKSIRSWGDEPPLQELWLHSCSLSASASLELVQSLSSCRHLTMLDLGENNLGEAGHQLAKSIRSWGDEPPLQKLLLYNCSIPAAATLELVQSLSTCRHITELDLGENKLGEAGLYLAESIRSWGDNSSLLILRLYNCSMPVKVCEELLISLSKCWHLTHLDLGRNTLKTAGHHLVALIRSLPYSSQLQELKFRKCKMSMDICSTLLQALSTCKKLVILDLSKNMLGEAGHHLAQSIRNWGNDPPLQKLYLTDTSIPIGIWSDILQSLEVCRRLTFLDVPDVLDENRYFLQIRGSTRDDKLQQPEFEGDLLQPINKYQSMETPRKPSEKELSETKIKMPKENKDMEMDDIKKVGFNFGSVVLKTQDVKENVIKKEKSSLSSLLTLATESIGAEQVTGLRSERSQITFEAQVRKNNKEILAARTFGKKVKIKDPLSDISLEVASGVKSLVLQSVNVDFHLLRKIIPATECLAAPVVQIHIIDKEDQEIAEGCKYKITIPHYLSRQHSFSSVRVRYGNLRRPLMMKEVDLENQIFPCFKMNKKSIMVYANHFCPVVCTSTQKICTSKILAIPFGWIGTLGSDSDTHLKVKTYLCSYLYKNSDLNLKLKTEAGLLGLEMLEQLTLPIDYEDFVVEKSEVSVGLTVTDPGNWVPTNPNDRTWDGTFKKMVERSKLPGVFNISNGHLCKSEPFDAANFALTCDAGKTSFRGNIGVTLHIPKLPDQYRDVNILLPPLKTRVIGPIGNTAKPENETKAEGTSELQPSSGLRFTDVNLVDLSNSITKPKILRTLAVVGLKMKRKTVDTHLQNEADINDAAYGVLNEWMNTQVNDIQAYTNICKALTDAQLEHLKSSFADSNNSGNT